MAKRKTPDLLSQDAAAARAAGMTYGKWRLMQDREMLEKRQAAYIEARKRDAQRGENNG